MLKPCLRTLKCRYLYNQVLSRSRLYCASRTSSEIKRNISADFIYLFQDKATWIWLKIKLKTTELSYISVFYIIVHCRIRLRFQRERENVDTAIWSAWPHEQKLKRLWHIFVSISFSEAHKKRVTCRPNCPRANIDSHHKRTNGPDFCCFSLTMRAVW